MTTNTTAPVNTGLEPFPDSRGTAGNDTNARRSPIPPLYRAGTGREPGTAPTWLDQQIARSRRKARPTNCPRCGTETLVGPDHDTCSMTARIDTTPVDPITEVAALLTGRHSYDLIRGAIHHREPEHHHSPNRPHPVHLDHTCPTTSGDNPCLF